MILLDVDRLRKHFGPEAVLSGVTFQVRPGERISLIGPNGSGKTTLLRIIAGMDEADAGTCAFHSSVHLGYLEQQPQFEPGRTLWHEAAGALAKLLSLQDESLAVAEAIAECDDSAERDRLSARYDHVQHELHRHAAYNLDHKIERVLEGLGFRKETFTQPADSLSGGEQNRLILAKLLLAEPNLLLMDEPSNHLDIEATEWLEDYLLDSSAAMILVSHDRCFLDKVTNATVELFHGTVDSYAGNFTAYCRQKAERLLVQQRTYDKQQIEIAKTKEFIRRNTYGQKHAQAEDRRRKLERIEPVERPRKIERPPMGFPPASRSGDIVLRVNELAKGYERKLFAELTFEITRGQRWGLLGPNGCGKTTLLQCMIGLIEPDEGNVTLGQGVEIGYFDQHLAELDDRAAAVEAIRPQRKEFDLQQRRDLLARFGLGGDTALQTVDSLSGGERCRAALGRLAASDANFLVLDEPTNHLDLWAREALQRALTSFDGTVLFVSHDRYFLNKVADHLLVVEPNLIRVVEGNYTTYQQMGHLRMVSPPPAACEAPPPKQPAPRTAKAEKEPSRPRRRFPYRKVADLEEEIFARETSVEELQHRLAQGDTHRDGDLVRQIKTEIAQEQAALKTLYAHWEEATELNW